MQELVSRLRQSASAKVTVIGLLVLILLIPLAMIRSVILDREQTGQAATTYIQQTWGGDQLLAGPVLVIPYDVVHTTNAGAVFNSRRHFHVLPESLDIDADVRAEIRSRGIFEVPVYTSNIKLRGKFPRPDLSQLKVAEDAIDWSGLFVAVGVTDGRAIAEIPALRLAGEVVRFEPGGNRVAGLPPQIVAPIGKLLQGADRLAALTFEIELALKGSRSLRFLPAGDTTSVALRSSWPAPSFSGNYLPESHEIDASGFSARWQVSSIGRTFPSHWTDESGGAVTAEQSSFGVDLYVPISIYRLTERAAKYGILFIGLTFVSYFLFEVVAAQRLHPLQYLLVGLANCVFYLLLISLAEHIGFGWSYLLSCIASAALIVAYSRTLLGGRGRALIMAAVLGLLYGFLYLTLNAETYAMLAGAIGLWAVLAAIMYLTRRIDWYRRPDVPG
ncbi:MAG: cell envelope integrity protein CreD [Gammaproteobacteria bacterium]|nr:cell envelope integrity protein CreD [Gammaproteobacteria bacterium]MDH5304956.1 cell envelope integrity protein CreD [Gammaproteobacteria bacterium]